VPMTYVNWGYRSLGGRGRIVTISRWLDEFYHSIEHRRRCPVREFLKCRAFGFGADSRVQRHGRRKGLAIEQLPCAVGAGPAGNPSGRPRSPAWWLSTRKSFSIGWKNGRWPAEYGPAIPLRKKTIVNSAAQRAVGVGHYGQTSTSELLQCA
jgi:hypothetical protein